MSATIPRHLRELCRDLDAAPALLIDPLTMTLSPYMLERLLQVRQKMRVTDSIADCIRREYGEVVFRRCVEAMR